MDFNSGLFASPHEIEVEMQVRLVWVSLSGEAAELPGNRIPTLGAPFAENLNSSGASAFSFPEVQHGHGTDLLILRAVARYIFFTR